MKSLQTLTKEAPALCEGGWINEHNWSSAKDEDPSNSNQRSTSTGGPKKHKSSAKLKEEPKLELYLYQCNVTE
jgi:hypothetical protein